MVSRGLITIATGNIHYYKIAANLLLSYKHFSKNPYPFAIVAEEENKYTALFDDVIITKEAMQSFNDKFLLLKLCPYDETIFFDADCLAYGDLNEYWKFFEGATDFSSLGENFGLEDNNGAWYNLDGIGDYSTMISYKTRVHSGVLFVRKSPSLIKMYEDCMALYREFDSLRFHTCPYSIDECVLGVTMPMNKMKARSERAQMMAAYPCLTKLRCCILKGKLSYSTPWDGYTEDGILLHWGTKQTYRARYRFEIECLKTLVTDKDSFINRLKYRYKLRFVLLKIPELPGDIYDGIKQGIHKLRAKINVF